MSSPELNTRPWQKGNIESNSVTHSRVVRKGSRRMSQKGDINMALGRGLRPLFYKDDFLEVCQLASQGDINYSEAARRLHISKPKFMKWFYHLLQAKPFPPMVFKDYLEGKLEIKPPNYKK